MLDRPDAAKEEAKPKVIPTLTTEEMALETAWRLRALEADLEPIPCAGKAPCLPSWQTMHITKDVIAEWGNNPRMSSTGLRTKRMPTLDSDISDPEACKKLQQIFLNFIGEGPVLTRIGRAPRFAIPCRTDKAFKKIYVTFTDLNGEEQKLEILADGQQVVAHGIHEKTGTPYQWIGGEPGEVRRDELPLLSEKVAWQFMGAAVKALTEMGWRVTGGNFGKQQQNGARPSREYTDKPAYAELEDALDHMPNDLSYEEWINVGFALYDGLGDDGFSLWDKFSRKYPEHIARDITIKWPSFKKPGPIKYRTIFFYARRSGWRSGRPDWASSGADYGGSSSEDSSSGRDNGGSSRRCDAWPFKFARDFDLSFHKNWIVKGVWAPGEISNFCAAPKKGKSSLVADLAIHVAADTLDNWRSYKVKQRGPIVYFALERGRLVERRYNAQCKAYGLDPTKLPFVIVNVPVDMMSQYSVAKFVATIRAVEEEWGAPAKAAIIDTGAKAINNGGGDENLAKDKGLFRANARKILLELEYLHLALVTHTGKDEKKGERGSNAGLGDDDILIMLNGQIAAVAAANDSAEGVLTHYSMKPVNVGTDEDGEPIVVGIIDPDTSERAPSSDAAAPKGQNRTALEFLFDILNIKGIPTPDSLRLPKDIRRVVLFQDWEVHCQHRGLSKGNPDSFRTAMGRVCGWLLSNHWIGIDGDYVWPVWQSSNISQPEDLDISDNR